MDTDFFCLLKFFSCCERSVMVVNTRVKQFRIVAMSHPELGYQTNVLTFIFVLKHNAKLKWLWSKLQPWWLVSSTTVNGKTTGLA